MLLVLAAALLLVQGLGAFLVYRAQHEGFQNAMLNAAAVRLITQTRGPEQLRPRWLKRSLDRQTQNEPPFGGPPPRGFRLEISETSPFRPGERRDTSAEKGIARILAEQSIPVEEVVAVHRTVGEDPLARLLLLRRAQRLGAGDSDLARQLGGHMLVVGIRQRSQPTWAVVRVRTPRAGAALIRPLLIQTLVIYAVLMVAVTLLLRQITRPLAALTRRVERFSHDQNVEGQLAPSGPDDMRRLIVAHNAMEARVAAMLDEKDVMLGAIGHDLKTPLAALRVRIESVEDDTERRRMADTIEDIVRTLDDILSLARVGRPSDPLERTELSALVASVVEEYEDMGEPVELAETQRIVLEIRPTWLRRALRNLIGNALRYGERASVVLRLEQGRAVIEIADEGPGIPEGTIEAMMNPFTRGDPSRNSGTGGAGLGLALARAIADQHGGALNLANRLAPGGRVAGLIATLELPVA
jgi:signal transduction histidine kinase